VQTPKYNTPEGRKDGANPTLYRALDAWAARPHC